MNNTRTGKIARLPQAIRDQLNLRLQNGERAKRLVAWLNALPEVQLIIGAEFGGKPVREQNLSEWKQGGHRDWLLQRETLALAQHLAEEMTELQAAFSFPPASPLPKGLGEGPGVRAANHPSLTDMLALWLAARYALATRSLAAEEGPEHWQRLRELCADVVELRRGDHLAQRLQLERERLTGGPGIALNQP